jgi:hypothetical protein
MSKYNVGDKFVIEIEKAFKDEKEPFGLPVLYRIKGFNALVFDEYGLDKLQKLNPQKKIEDIDDMLAEHEIRHEAFDAGMEEAWKMANLILRNADDGGIPISEIKQMFNCSYTDVFSKFTPQETKAIIEAYQEKQKTIHVGDIVTNGHVTMLVTGIGGESGLLFLLGKNGEILTRQKPENFTRTGQTIDIMKILSQIDFDEELPFQ